jgi:hypothetical protein
MASNSRRSCRFGVNFRIEIMKIMVVFYSWHVCPWIPGERKKFSYRYLSLFLGNIFFQIFQENFEIGWSCYGSEKSIIFITLLNFLQHGCNSSEISWKMPQPDGAALKGLNSCFRWCKLVQGGGFETICFYSCVWFYVVQIQHGWIIRVRP